MQMEDTCLLRASSLAIAIAAAVCAAPARADPAWRSCDWTDPGGTVHHVRCAQTWFEVTDTNRDCTVQPGFDCVPGSTQTYRLNTFVYVPCDEHVAGCEQARFPVIQERVPYGIGSTANDASRLDPTKGSTARATALLRGWKRITDHGYAAVFQDMRGRFGSEGADHVYGDDDRDGAAMVDWIAAQSWCDGNVGAAGSSAGSISAYAAAARRPPALKAIFAQAGGSSILNGVVYEGQTLELERLMLWVSSNIVGAPPASAVGLSDFSLLGIPGKGHAQLLEQFGGPPSLRDDLKHIQTLGAILKGAEKHGSPKSFVTSPEWMTLPLLNYPASCGAGGNAPCKTPPPSGYSQLPDESPLRPYFAEWQPYLDELMSHPTRDAFRDRHDFYKEIDIPVFHSGAWYDIFANTTIRAFTDLQGSKRGSAPRNQKLFVGPGEHYSVYWNSKRERFFPTTEGFDPAVETDPYFEWFDYWLKGRDVSRSEIMERPAIYFSPIDNHPQYDYLAARCYPEDPNGARDCYWANCEAHRASDPNVVCKPEWSWRYADEWPLPDVKEQVRYLQPGGSLGAARPSQAKASSTYRYDPMNPVPTFGGRNLSMSKGPADQTPAREGRSDVLTFSGKVLEEPVTIAGNVKVVAYVSSNRDDTDFVAKLIDLDQDPRSPTQGRASLVQDGIVRAVYRNSATRPEPLEPGRIYAVTIDLGEVLHTFPAGHVIQLDVTSSNFPRRARNPNNYAALAAKGGSVAAATYADVRTADNRIHHDHAHPSHVVLPVYKPFATAFTGSLQVKAPDGLAFSGNATLHAFPTGMFLRFGPAADGKWHWRKWAATQYQPGARIRHYEGRGSLGVLRASVKLERGKYTANASGDGIVFRDGAALY
jgi:predicted acyl esterase